ncbi:hypothetical protein ABXN37_13820 [Piscinibacter sakaiensis]|uniref:hypothetical protein n=1 Tax=Piscinibacter sakaiensis TaxID=1547922 RepID=UPI003727A037
MSLAGWRSRAGLCLMRPARPGCPVCGPQQRAALGRWRGPALPVEALGDPLLGLFSCAECIVPLDGDPQALCHAASVQVHTAGNRHAVSARGQGHDAARAALGQLDGDDARLAHPGLRHAAAGRGAGCARGGPGPPLPGQSSRFMVGGFGNGEWGRTWAPARPCSRWRRTAPPDLAACGWSVQRVLAPGLPIYGHGRVGTPGRFLAAWGWPPAALPHPYR